LGERREEDKPLRRTKEEERRFGEEGGVWRLK
jgi:hypothetical protein